MTEQTTRSRKTIIVDGVPLPDVLDEQMVHDESGQLLTSTFMDYAMPKAPSVPPIDVVLVEVPAPDGPFGARIVGEPPIIPPIAAIGNAIKAATGKRLAESPMTSERVLNALNG